MKIIITNNKLKQIIEEETRSELNEKFSWPWEDSPKEKKKKRRLARQRRKRRAARRAARVVAPKMNKTKELAEFFKELEKHEVQPEGTVTPPSTSSEAENYCMDPSTEKPRNDGKTVPGIPKALGDFVCKGGTAINMVTKKSMKASPVGPAAEKAPVKNNNYIMPFVFPDYVPALNQGETLTMKEKMGIRAVTGEWPKPGKCGKLGHAGVILVQFNGLAYLAEFGRYGTPKGKGRIKFKKLGVLGKFDERGKLINFKEVAIKAKGHTQGDGPRMRMIVAMLPIKNVRAAVAHMKRKGLLDYIHADEATGGAANCGTFAYDAAVAGGAEGVEPADYPFASQVASAAKGSAPWATPIGMIQILRSKAEAYFEI